MIPEPTTIPMYVHVPKNAGTYIMVLNQIYYARRFAVGGQIHVRRVAVSSAEIDLTILTYMNDDYYLKDPNMENSVRLPNLRGSICTLDTYTEYIKNKHATMLAMIVEPTKRIDQRAGCFAAWSLAKLAGVQTRNSFVIREPYSRQQSIYNYLTSDVSSHEPTHGNIQCESFLDYVMSPHLEDSWTVRAFGGVPDDMSLNESWYQHATSFIEDNKFDVVDIKTIDEYMNRVIEDCYGEPIPDIIKDNERADIVNNENNNTFKINFNDLPETHQQHFTKHTEWDKKLYNHYV